MELINFLLMGIYFAASMLLGIVALNSRQAYRPVLLAALVTCAVLSFRQISDASFGVWGCEVFAMFIIIYISHISCVLCVEKYVLPEKPGVTFDWVGGYKMLFNARWLGTSRQAPDIKGSQTREIASDIESEQRQEEYAMDPSKRFRTMFRSPRAVFIRDRVISLVLTLIAEKAFSYSYLELAPKYGLQMDIMDFLPTKESYFRRITEVTLRETLVRSWMVTFFLFYSVCLYNTIHDALAIIFVGSKFDNPEDWPSLFGSVSDATSIRNFWGKFWHRLVYRSYTSYGIWISKNILRLPKSSFIGKLFINFFVFAMSGGVHSLAIMQLGFSCGAWQEFRFYLFNFCGILVEMAAMAAYSKFTKGYKMNSTVSKTIGYCWVFLFLFTVLPKSQYPKVFCAPVHA